MKNPKEKTYYLNGVIFLTITGMSEKLQCNPQTVQRNLLGADMDANPSFCRNFLVPQQRQFALKLGALGILHIVQPARYRLGRILQRIADEAAVQVQLSKDGLVALYIANQCEHAHTLFPTHRVDTRFLLA